MRISEYALRANLHLCEQPWILIFYRIFLQIYSKNFVNFNKVRNLSEFCQLSNSYCKFHRKNKQPWNYQKQPITLMELTIQPLKRLIKSSSLRFDMIIHIFISFWKLTIRCIDIVISSPCSERKFSVSNEISFAKIPVAIWNHIWLPFPHFLFNYGYCLLPFLSFKLPFKVFSVHYSVRFRNLRVLIFQL